MIAACAPSEWFYAVLVGTKTVAGKSGKSDPTPYKDVGKGQKAPVKKQKLWFLPQKKPAWSMATAHVQPTLSAAPRGNVHNMHDSKGIKFVCLNHDLMLYSAGHKQHYVLW